MGKYSVPESICQQKPKGTMMKNIFGHYYAYEYSNYTDSSGRRRTKMGKAIGAIKEGLGFVPNTTVALDSEISSLDFGEYAVSISNSGKTRSLLWECFNPEDAARIYGLALIHFIQGFTYIKDVKDYYDMSVLSLMYPSIKMGYRSLSSLYDSLGRRQGSVLRMEEEFAAMSSGQIAIDDHVIGCGSTENDLAEKDYMMAYDVNTGMPLLSRIYDGASNGKVSVKDFLSRIELRNMLFIIDRGFYSTENANLFSNDGNAYIIPLAKNLKTCQSAVHNLEMHDRFMYKKGRKASVVEYKDEIIGGYRVLTYRDLNELAVEQENYLRHIGRGDKTYTKEGFERGKHFMGGIVLQTSIEDQTPQEVYGLYKKRWQIETFYNYFKNKAGYNSLHEQDYYKTQGLAFVMLISALTHKEFEVAVASIQGKSIQDCLLEARMVKTHKRHGKWSECNLLKRQADLFSQLNTKPVVDVA